MRPGWLVASHPSFGMGLGVKALHSGVVHQL